MSSEMMALKDKKEASVMLKEELKESNLRVKAVKQGHSVNSISEKFSNAFYMPDKGKYTVHPPKPSQSIQQKLAQQQRSTSQSMMPSDRSPGTTMQRGSPEFERMRTSSFTGANELKMR